MLVLADASRPGVVRRFVTDWIPSSTGAATDSRPGPGGRVSMVESDPRSPLSIGIGWASRITALGFEFSLPPIAGYFADRWLGSNPIGTLAGMVVGFLVGMMHLLRIARESSKSA